ncbi:hypothetical protein GCM10010428_17460 [Actinosynnema pretiosum subsp. pretiosum]
MNAFGSAVCAEWPPKGGTVRNRETVRNVKGPERESAEMRNPDVEPSPMPAREERTSGPDLVPADRRRSGGKVCTAPARG